MNFLFLRHRVVLRADSFRASRSMVGATNDEALRDTEVDREQLMWSISGAFAAPKEGQTVTEPPLRMVPR